jgi:hypothetical protein
LRGDRIDVDELAVLAGELGRHSTLVRVATQRAAP